MGFSLIVLLLHEEFNKVTLFRLIYFCFVGRPLMYA